MTFFLKRLWNKATGKKKAKKAAKKEKARKKKYLKKQAKGKHLKKISPYSKEQDKLLKWLTKSVTGKLPKEFDISKQPTYKAGQDYLTRLLSNDPSAMEAFEAPARRQFREEIMPEIAEQYAGAGAGRSSAFNLAATHAGGTLAEQLAAQRAQLQLGAIPQALQYAQIPVEQRAALARLPLGQQQSYLYEPPYAPGEIPKTSGGTMGGILGAIGGGVMGGPVGALAGYQFGSGIGGAATDVDGSERGINTQVFSSLGKGLGKAAGNSLWDLLGKSGDSKKPVGGVQKVFDAPEAATPFAQTMAVS